MRKLPRTLSAKSKNRAGVTRFVDFVNKTCGLNIGYYDGLHRWPVESIPELGAAIWDFVEIRASRKYDQVLDDLVFRFPGAEWLLGARLNFAVNPVRFLDGRPAKKE